MRAIIVGALILASGAFATEQGEEQRGMGGGGEVPSSPCPSDERASRAQPEQVGAHDDTLPHTNPEMQEGIGGSGPVDPGDVDEPLPDEPQFPEETIVFPPLEALKPFSEGQEGTGGSGMTPQLNPVIGQVHARSQERLVVQDVQRDVYALTLEPDTCISREGKAISLDELDAGDTIRARWSIRDGQRVATWVDVLRDASQQNQGTGGSGREGTGGEEEPFVEPLGNDEFQGH